MTDIIYVVECSSGTYDSYSWWIGGIFTNVMDANSHAKKLNDQMAQQLQEPRPIDKVFEDMTEEEQDKDLDYDQRQYDANEWHPAKVEQYPLNKPVLE